MSPKRRHRVYAEVMVVVQERALTMETSPKKKTDASTTSDGDEHDDVMTRSEQG